MFPPLEEQKAIAGVLSSLDDKIDLLHRQNKTLESLAETMFRQWFIEEAKEEWEEKGLDEIAVFLNGLPLQNYPPIGINDLPVIKIREMKQGITTNTELCNSIPEKYLVSSGNILFSWSGSLDVVIWNGTTGALNQHLYKVTSETFPDWFCYFAVKHHLPDFRTIAESKSTTMGHIQRDHLSKAKISVPDRYSLEYSSKSLGVLFLRMKANYSQIHTLKNLRDTLLPKLMTGEVRACLGK